ncbi:MAG: hypothetical protein JST02_01855 [Bacteroidetes bacterium]|nr:hypothetical protein [Bacteroidota bacterium]
MQELTPDSSFEVKEAIFIDVLAAGFFYLMFFSAISYAWRDKMIFITLIPALLFTARIFIKSVPVKVNKDGIWLARDFVCNWHDFIAARTYMADLEAGGWNDREFLEVEYFKGTEGDAYKRTMKLESTLNRSAEEIIYAIEYFHGEYKKDAG